MRGRGHRVAAGGASGGVDGRRGAGEAGRGRVLAPARGGPRPRSRRHAREGSQAPRRRRLEDPPCPGNSRSTATVRARVPTTPRAGSAPSTGLATASRSTSIGSTPRTSGPPPSCTSALRPKATSSSPTAAPPPSLGLSPTGSANRTSCSASGTAPTSGSTPFSPPVRATGPSPSTHPGTRSRCARGPCASGLVRYRHADTESGLATSLLDGSRDPVPAISDLDPARGGVEERYKTGTFRIEAFHAQSERGVRPELYAAFVLITLARPCANRCDHDLDDDDGDDRPALRTHVRNGLRLVGKEIEARFLAQSVRVARSVKRIRSGLSRCIPRERPGRSSVRQSKPPRSKGQHRVPACPPTPATGPGPRLPATARSTGVRIRMPEKLIRMPLLHRGLPGQRSVSRGCSAVAAPSAAWGHLAVASASSTADAMRAPRPGGGRPGCFFRPEDFGRAVRRGTVIPR